MRKQAKREANGIRRIAVGCAVAALTLSTILAATKVANNPAPSGDSELLAKRLVAAATNISVATAQFPAPSTPREYFNAGTRELSAKKYREAEAFLESALASQQEELQFPALYNLGHVRFDQGMEELKKNPSPNPTVARGKATTQMADDAIRVADEALAGDDVQKMVTAYMHGRGVRKDMKSATTAVQDALNSYRMVLGRWERASGDFKGAMEIKKSSADAEQNAEVVDRCIAKLVDSLRKMQQCSAGMSDKGKELGDKLQKLKGRIPAPNMPPGAAGDDDEDEENPFGPKPGQKEGPTKEGKQIALTPEQAGWLLDGFKLDGERRLPMAQGEAGQPKDRGRATW